jgi:hypothetical protein
MTPTAGFRRPRCPLMMRITAPVRGRRRQCPDLHVDDEEVGKTMSEHGALRQRRTVLEHEWARRVPQSKTAARHPAAVAPLRREVTESWGRCVGTVDPGRDSAPVSEDGEVHPRCGVR